MFVIDSVRRGSSSGSGYYSTALQVVAVTTVLPYKCSLRVCD
jgi:hypothetical protein